MKIGLIDVDSRNFPNIPLMKLSAWHKSQGDSVEWYDPMLSGHMDKVYISKIFSASLDYQYCIDADEIITGGSGYCISVVDGRETFDRSKDTPLPHEIEHIYPDYGLYGIEDTAFGQLTRGCPRACDFCHVSAKEGRISHKVADLNEFWRGQKDIVLCDPNILACKQWKELLQQLIDSKAYVDFNQGLDIRFMSEEKAEMVQQIKMRELHFAWDRYQDKEIILPMLKAFRERSTMSQKHLTVYVLCNNGTTFEQDLERVYTLRDMGFSPYVMLYDKEHIPRGHRLKALQRWCNNRFVFWQCADFNDYQGGRK